MANITKIAIEKRYKVVFMGDTKQFKSIGAGDLFLDMQKYGASVITLSKTLRQKTKETKHIVNLLKTRKSEQLFKFLEENKYLEEKSNEDIYQSIVNYYENKNSLIITSKNSDKNILNSLIRERLEQINNVDIKVNELYSLNGVEKYIANSYIGLKATAFRVPKISNGEEFEIVEAKNDYTLIVQLNNKKIEIDLKKYANNLTLFKEETKSFSHKEKIIFTKNSKEFKNGEIDYINSINEDGTINLKSGKKI